MKTYTFEINKKNTTPSYNNSDNRSYIDALIRTNVSKIAPYIDTIDDDYESDFIVLPKKKKTVIDITIKKPKKSKIRTSLDFNKYLDFEKAIDILTSSYDSLDTYDFTINGTPVKIFSDGEIQIGYELFNMYGMNKSLYDTLSTSTKKTIIDICVSLNK